MNKKSIINFTVIALIAATLAMFTVTSCKKEEKIVTPATPGNEFLTTAILTCSV
jgi:hypothetical protein